MGRVILQVQAKLSGTGDGATNLVAMDYLGEWELRLDGGNKVQDGVQDGLGNPVARLQYALSLRPHRAASGRVHALFALPDGRNSGFFRGFSRCIADFLIRRSGFRVPALILNSRWCVNVPPRRQGSANGMVALKIKLLPRPIHSTIGKSLRRPGAL